MFRAPSSCSVPAHFFVPDLEIFPQLEGLKLEADDKLIYLFDIDTVPVSDDSKDPMVSIFITDVRGHRRHIRQ
jgi:hypothetical protein